MLTIQCSTSHGNVAAVNNVMAHIGIHFASIVRQVLATLALSMLSKAVGPWHMSGWRKL